MPTIGFDFEFPNDPIFRDGGVKRVVFEEMTKFMREALRDGKNIGAPLTPVGGTGDLVKSLGSKFTEQGPVDFKGEVAWRASYAQTVARGGPPRLVNRAKLAQWADAVLGSDQDTDFIQAAIRRQGTPSPRHPNPGTNMDVKLFDQWEPRVCDLFERMACRIAQRLGV